MTAKHFPTNIENKNPSGSTADPDFLDGFISEHDYAARRGVSLRTCQRDRQLRQAPPYVVIGRRVLYRIEAVRAWLIANERTEDRIPAASRSRTGR